MLGHCVPIVKDILKWMPSLGWAMWLMDTVFLKRVFKRDQAYVGHIYVLRNVSHDVCTLCMQILE